MARGVQLLPDCVGSARYVADQQVSLPDNRAKHARHLVELGANLVQTIQRCRGCFAPDAELPQNFMSGGHPFVYFRTGFERLIVNAVVTQLVGQEIVDPSIRFD